MAWVFLIFLAVLLIGFSPAAQAAAPIIEPLEEEAALTFSFGALCEKGAAVYQPDLAYLAAVLSKQAYEAEPSTLLAWGFENIVTLKNGMLEGHSQSGLDQFLRKVSITTLPATNGFFCTKQVEIAGESKTLVVVSIAGTVMESPVDLTDWMRDLNFEADDEGRHEGYALNMRGLMALEGAVHFPTLDCTLLDVIQACAQGSGEYQLLLTGHSMGGGIVNLYQQALVERGLSARHLVAYTFACPLTVAQGAYESPGGYPSLNLINVEDVITYVGVDGFDGTRLGTDYQVRLSRAFKDTHGLGSGRNLLAMIRTLRDAYDLESVKLAFTGVTEFMQGIGEVFDAHEPETYVAIAAAYR